MGSRTIDFWLEFEDEFLVCAIEARWRFPQISTLICGCKNQQTLKTNVFVWRHNFAQNHASNRETEPVCGSAKVPGIVWESISHSRRKNPMEVGRAQIVSTRRFWLPSVHCRLNFLFLLKNTFCPDLWRSRNISHTGP